MEVPLSKASTYESGYEYAWVRVTDSYSDRLVDEGDVRLAENLMSLLPTFQPYEFAGVSWGVDDNDVVWAQVKIKRGYEMLGMFVAQHAGHGVESVSVDGNTVVRCMSCEEELSVDEDSLHKDFAVQT